ncbi:MAG TPA: ACT domain-containing protein [Thermoleophilia bacterium]|mgnify:FL=1|nr:ACT domain-containing protein [Acidobacteriota bacterium]HQJ26798.1 ACT domain-containing protein [Thermoleophilia bacterium]
MKVKQLTVFLENRSGRLAEVADILGRAGINIRGFSTTEAAEYGILRLILTDPERARALLHDAGFTTHFSEVLCVKVEDAPGGLAGVLAQLADAGVSIDYLYSISFWNICFAVRDIDRAVELLKDEVTLLTDEEVRGL